MSLGDIFTKWNRYMQLLIEKQEQQKQKQKEQLKMRGEMKRKQQHLILHQIWDWSEQGQQQSPLQKELHEKMQELQEEITEFNKLLDKQQEEITEFKKLLDPLLSHPPLFLAVQQKEYSQFLTFLEKQLKKELEKNPESEKEKYYPDTLKYDNNKNLV